MAIRNMDKITFDGDQIKFPASAILQEDLEGDISELKEDLNTKTDPIGYAEKTFTATAGTAHSSFNDQVIMRLEEGDLFEITVESTPIAVNCAVYFYKANGGSTYSQFDTNGGTRSYVAAENITKIGVYVGSQSQDINITFSVSKKGIVSDVSFAEKKIDILTEDSYYLSLMTPTATSSGWKLVVSNGLCVSDSSYKLVKYQVTAGQTIKIVSDSTFQFQNSASVPSSGASNRVGKTYITGTYLLKVPEGATYLIVSTPLTDSASAVYYCEPIKIALNVAQSSIAALDDRFITVVGKNLFNVNDEDNHFGTSGSDCYAINSSGDVYHSTSMDAAYSVSHFIPVTAGKTVYFSFANGQTYAYQVARYDLNKSYLGTTTWVGSYEIPSGTAYIRVTASTLAATFQAEYDARTSYEAYSDEIYLNAKVSSSNVVQTSPDKDYLVIPNKIYGMQGKEYDIFFKNIIAGNINRFVVGVSGTGTWFSRRIRYNESTSGNKSTTIRLYDEDYNLLQSKTITYVSTSADAHSGETLKVLTIGDSFINSGYVTSGLINDFADDVANLQLLGTLGTAPNLHEGRAGWSSYEYTHEASVGSVSNPFLNNGVFDFSNYMSVSEIDVPDYVIINLGINDGWKPMHGTTTSENVQAMIDSIHSYNSDIKVIIGTTPSTYLGDDGENGYLMHLMDLNKRQGLTKNVMDNIIESSTVIICPTHVNFDTDYNFNTSTTTKNGQNNGTVPYCTDETHPAASGFYQIADSYYACIKAN